jgi:hypothetical protein
MSNLWDVNLLTNQECEQRQQKSRYWRVDAAGGHLFRGVYDAQPAMSMLCNMLEDSVKTSSDWTGTPVEHVAIYQESSLCVHHTFDVRIYVLLETRVEATKDDLVRMFDFLHYNYDERARRERTDLMLSMKDYDEFKSLVNSSRTYLQRDYSRAKAAIAAAAAVATAAPAPVETKRLLRVRL